MKFKSSDGNEYELESKWIHMAHSEYLELVNGELESLNGGAGGMNLLTLPFSISTVAELILAGIACFKGLGLPPLFVARMVTSSLINAIPSEKGH